MWRSWAVGLEVGNQAFACNITSYKFFVFQSFCATPFTPIIVFPSSVRILSPTVCTPGQVSAAQRLLRTVTTTGVQQRPQIGQLTDLNQQFPFPQERFSWSCWFLLSFQLYTHSSRDGLNKLLPNWRKRYTQSAPFCTHGAAKSRICLSFADFLLP